MKFLVAALLALHAAVFVHANPAGPAPAPAPVTLPEYCEFALSLIFTSRTVDS